MRKSLYNKPRYQLKIFMCSIGAGDYVEMSRSWSSAHDWKSCIPQKGIESSNLSISAIIKRQATCGGLSLFYIRQKAAAPAGAAAFCRI